MNKPCEDDKVIAFAISIYESQGYPPNSFEMLDYQMSRKFVLQAEHLMRCGYARSAEKAEIEFGNIPIKVDPSLKGNEYRFEKTVKDSDGRRPDKDKIHDEVADIFLKYEEIVDSYGATIVPQQNTDNLFIEVRDYILKTFSVPAAKMPSVESIKKTIINADIAYTNDPGKEDSLDDYAYFIAQAIHSLFANKGAGE